MLWPDLQEQAMSAIASASERVGPTLHIATVLSRAGWGDFSSEEKAWIARIEHRRHVTNSSKEVIHYQGFMPHSRDTVFEVVVGERSRVSSKPPAEAALLFSLVRQQKPASCIEMGTCVGISGSYIAAALRLNNRGKLVSLEGVAAFAEVARRNFAALSLEGVAEVVVGPFHETLSYSLEDASPIDFIFIDGHHDEQATTTYFETALPFLAPLSIAVFDDINWSEGMKRAWSSISAAPQCTARFSLRNFGIAVLRGA
jgi:predicted O-methyltransferase YrrM